MRSRGPALLLLLLTTTACQSFRYDLGSLPFPVSASPLRDAAAGDRFTLTGKHILWVHGLAGETKPDVAAELLANVLPCAAIADFRVETGSSFHDWLATHLSLGLVRMKTVTVTGVRLRPR
jgi:hypothetical protein